MEGLKQGLPSLVSEQLCCGRAVMFVVAHRLVKETILLI